MRKEDIAGLEINANQKQQLHKKLENSNYAIANIKLDTDVISAQAQMHEQSLINDKIKLKRYLEDKRAKQPKKDTKRHLPTIVMCTIFSSILSVSGLIMDNNKNIYMLLATLALFVPILAMNAIVFQPIVIRMYQEFKNDVMTISSLFISLSIVAGSIASNYIFTSKLTDIFIINIVLASGFDLIPLVVNLSVAKFESKYYVDTHENSVGYVKNASKNLRTQACKSASNDEEKGLTAIVDVEKKDVKSASKNLRTSALRTSVRKYIHSIDDMQNAINQLPDNTIITPKKLNMSKDKNYYNWLKKCHNVKKIDGKYMKVKSNISLVKKD